MSDERILEAAAHWHVRQDADDMDWEAFEAWLGADPRHRDAFDEIALLDRDIERHRDTLRGLLPDDVAEPVEPNRARWRFGLIGGAAAAAALAAVAVVSMRQGAPVESSTIVLRAGSESRDVRMASARITLAPGSSVVAEHGNASHLALTGRAAFSIVHDPSRVLTIRTQGYEIRDVGTRFEVVTGGGMVKVSVVEGEVTLKSVNGTAPATVVAAGSSATGLIDGSISRGAAGKAALDGWRDGPLVYEAVPLGLVAADVTRASGEQVVADPGIATRPFSGVLSVDRSGTMVQTLATLAGLEARRQGDTVHLRNRVSR